MKNYKLFIQEVEHHVGVALGRSKNFRDYFTSSEASHASGALSIIKADILHYLANPLKETLDACAEYKDDENTVKHIKNFVTNRREDLQMSQGVGEFEKAFFQIKKELFEEFLNNIEKNYNLI